MKKITIPIGSNVSIDGGPFFDFEGREAKDEGVIRGVSRHNEEPAKETFTIDEIQDALADEMKANQPIRLNTGDVGGGATIGTIRLPLCAGYTVEAFTLGEQEVWLLPNLNHYGRRRAVEQALSNHGGVVEG